MADSTILRIRSILSNRANLDLELAAALFDARLEGLFEEAMKEAGLSRKAALALTRAENERRGRQVRWQARKARA